MTNFSSQSTFAVFVQEKAVAIVSTEDISILISCPFILGAFQANLFIFI
jgi:hypothetical protein